MPVVSTPTMNRPSKRPARASALSQLNGFGNMGVIVARTPCGASHFSRWILARRARLQGPGTQSALYAPVAARYRARRLITRIANSKASTVIAAAHQIIASLGTLPAPNGVS